MKLFKYLICLLALLSNVAWGQSNFKVLSFHDIVQQKTVASEPDDVTADNLVNYFSWLKANGYNVISLQDVINAKNNGKKLPENSIVLTFDDGYKSFYTYVMPLLKAFQYPATLAIVGSWLDVPDNGTVLYADKKVPRSKFLSLKELKEVSRSGLVEIASHTYDLHHGVLGNVQGNTMPALTTFEYNKQTGEYESEEHYRQRIESDLVKNNAWIKQHTGKAPRIIVWPYGRYNGMAQAMAKKLGMDIAITLDDGENFELQPVDSIRRIYLINNPEIDDFVANLRKAPPALERVMHVDLDYVYDKDPIQQEKNLGSLLERVKESGVTTVYLQAFSDDDASGVAKSLYFKNNYMPVKADIFGRVSWQLKTRVGVKVFAWMPLLAFNPGPEKLRELDVVTSTDGSKGIGYLRLSPFSERSRQFIKGIYKDLGRHASFEGILIHDDATLSDKEDASPVALNYYAKHWGLPANIAAITQNTQYNEKWYKAKTQMLTQFALDMRSAAEFYRKPISIARNYYAEVALNPNSEEWFAQSIPNGLEHFNWVALMAMPYMENASNPSQWLSNLVDKTQVYPKAKKKLVYEFQAKDWKTDKPIPTKELSSWMRTMRVRGIYNFGYYPDDQFTNNPKMEILKRELSTKAALQ
ncbi:poly-beta-1,6-N-acetyl-D-glucosamine N-deacetylase PgaB [Polynucleobacter sp. AP-Kolm-20A-A1]|uniref:poly-beta-1,6-N-acetyl-D-glucosamine N-deacetylase PgaB n=1 Tax=Polynucleobacter sp. AP-Kolm-20A-A1 TaxID=2081041 RepID=UPI001BFED5A4|nr:poly-beta-1,6-N-acetyl-D-glucosamine N-deacetylase PgaB [Polynucleobacter sp. AP-Kolm-20A-A1]QWE19976.1 poly-beta-1,6-N-acetyl-D-glucosamine N-deacetylase PgaB [Polynucleobacter sp. AP-Kolm-20A-A1]